MNEAQASPPQGGLRHPLAAPLLTAAAGRIAILHAPPGFGKSVILRLIDPGTEAAAKAGPVVLDDVDRDALSRLEPKLSEQIGRGVVLATRDGVVAAEIGLRFPGRCEIISSQDLRLDVGSIEAELPLERRHLAAAIHALTAGWPLATHLLIANHRLLCEDRPTTMPGVVDDFLTEYFERLCDEQMETAALCHLSELLDYGELTHTLLRSAFEGDEVIDALRGLARRGAFVVETYDDHPRFLIEPLFARYLHRRFAGARAHESYGARALVLARNGFVRPALRLASLSDAPRAVAEVIEALGGMRVPLTLGYEAAEYFDRIGVAEFKRTDVLVARIYMSLQQGNVRFARDLMENFSAAATERDPHAARKLELLDFVLRFYENRPIPLSEMASYERRHAEDLCDDRIARAVLQQIRASTFYFQADLGESYACARYAMEVANSINAPLLTHYAKFYVALAEVRTGHLAHATALLEAASTMSGREFGAGNPQVSQASLILARIRVERLDWEGAFDLFDRHADAGDLHANWRDAAEMVAMTAAAVLHERAGIRDAIAYLDARETAYAHAQMPICAQMVATLKAQLFYDEGLFADAAEALVEARSHHALRHEEDLTSYGLQISLLHLRLAIEKEAATILTPDFEDLGRAIECSGDIALRLRLRMARHRGFALLGQGAAADRAIHDALHLAARHGMLWTLACELRREAAAHFAVLDRLNLSSTEVDCLERLRARIPSDPMAQHPVGAHPLSPRELQVLDFLADGLSSKEMARNLNISIGTVKGYRRKLYEKLNIYRRSDAVLAARTLHSGGSLELAKDYHAR